MKILLSIRGSFPSAFQIATTAQKVTFISLILENFTEELITLVLTKFLLFNVFFIKKLFTNVPIFFVLTVLSYNCFP